MLCLTTSSPLGKKGDLRTKNPHEALDFVTKDNKDFGQMHGEYPEFTLT